MHDVEGLSPDQYEIIGEKVTYRIAQRPSYQILKYRRPVVNRSTAQIPALPAPEASFAAGLLDRQVRLAPAAVPPASAPGGCRTRPGVSSGSPSWRKPRSARLPDLRGAAPRLIRASRVKAMDDPDQGRAGHGKSVRHGLRPVYGDRYEICFPFHPSPLGGLLSAAPWD